MKDEVQLWRSEALGGVELTWARYHAQRFAPHTHDTYMVGTVEEGVLAFESRGSHHRAAAGALVLLNPNEVHTGEGLHQRGWAHRMLYPTLAHTRAALRAVDSSDSGTPELVPVVVTEPEVVAQVRRAHQALCGSSSRLEADAHLLECLVLLLQRSGRIPTQRTRLGREHRAVTRARELLDAHLSEGISLEVLSRACGVSAFHLVRVFRHQMGMPPHAYQTQRRVALAQRLLSSGLAPGEVALETGFADQSHLTREFKRRTGMTPGQYARGLAA